MNTLRSKRFTGSLLAIGMFFAGLAGVVMLIFAGYATYWNHAAKHWPVVEGRVVSSRTVMVDEGNKGSRWVPRAEIWFSYSVDGKEYRSSHVSNTDALNIGGTFTRYDAPMSAKYPEGLAVKVAYNPSNPADAVIDLTRDPVASLCIGGVMVTTFIGFQIWLRGGEPARAGT